MPSVPGTPSVKKRNDDSWQKDDVSSVSNKGICPEAAQRNQVARAPPLLVLNHHTMPHLLLEYEPHIQTMKKQLSPCQNPRKELMMSSTPLGISTKWRGKS
jgi:hypothetical protein